MYWEFSNHNAFDPVRNVFGAGGIPGVTCLTRRQHLVQADMGGRNQLLHGSRLPAARACSTSRSAAALAWYGQEGHGKQPLPALLPGRFNTASKTEFNSEPIRLTFDACKAIVGRKYSHFVDSGWPIATGRTSSASTTSNGRRLNVARHGAEHQLLHRVDSLYAGVTVKF